MISNQSRQGHLYYSLFIKGVLQLILQHALFASYCLQFCAMPDHTCFTRLTTSRMWDSLAPGTAGRPLLSEFHTPSGSQRPVGKFYSTTVEQNPPGSNCHRHCRSGSFTRLPSSKIHQARIVTGTAGRAVLLEYRPAQCIDTSLSPGTAGFLKILKKCAICRKLCYNGENERRSR